MLKMEANIEGKTERSSMKILERIVDDLIQQVVSIEDTSRALSQEEHYICNRCGVANALPGLEKQLTVPLEDLSSES